MSKKKDCCGNPRCYCANPECRHKMCYNDDSRVCKVEGHYRYNDVDICESCWTKYSKQEIEEWIESGKWFMDR
jgi:hypothetical protein